MRLNKQNTLKVLSENFRLKIVSDDCVGDVVAMSAYEAYIYSAVTGHYYLDSDNRHFTPNGLMQIFHQANSYNLVTGMFDRDGNLYNTPVNQAEKMKFITQGVKHIVPVEYDTNANLKNKLTIIEACLQKHGKDPRDYIICRIKKSTSGYSMEPFMEYVATRYFNERGLLTETQIPFYYSGGTPDFAAYSLPDIKATIEKRLRFGGASFIGLASIRVFPERVDGGGKISRVETIVGEAKTGSTSGLEQVKKYLRCGVFNKAYEIIPHKESPEVTAGLFTFDENGEIQVYEATSRAPVIPAKQKEYISWIGDYIKYFLVANLYNEELDEIYGKATGNKTRTVGELISFINNTSLEEVLNFVAERVHGK